MPSGPEFPYFFLGTASCASQHLGISKTRGSPHTPQSAIKIPLGTLAQAFNTKPFWTAPAGAMRVPEPFSTFCLLDGLALRLHFQGPQFHSP